VLKLRSGAEEALTTPSLLTKRHPSLPQIGSHLSRNLFSGSALLYTGSTLVRELANQRNNPRRLLWTYSSGVDDQNDGELHYYQLQNHWTVARNLRCINPPIFIHLDIFAYRYYSRSGVTCRIAVLDPMQLYPSPALITIGLRVLVNNREAYIGGGEEV
jgi:hypothetical protein